jgi:HK97 family phage portal protein
MAWWSRAPKVEERSVSIADPVLAMMLGYTPADGVTVSESTALTLSAVFRAVSLVSGSIASLPLRTLEETTEGQKERVTSFLDTPGGKDKRLTAFEWKELVMVHLLLHGNAYLQHIYNGAGALVALNPIHPACVVPYWDDARPGGKRFVVTITKTGSPATHGSSETVELDADTMTQIMGVSLDGLKGLSAIALARLSLGTGLAGDKAANRQFSNGAMISGLVTPDGDEDMTEPEAQIVKESINRKMTGVENAGDIAVMNKRLKFQAWQLSAADAQFLESRTFQIDEVGRWFGVPPHLLGLTEKATSWGQGIAEQNRGLARYTMTPWTSRIDERMTLLLPVGRSAEFDYSAFVKPSPEDEINLLIAQVNSGLLTLNEARGIRNMPSLEGGDIPRFPAGSVPPVDPNAPAPIPEGAPA